MQYIIQKALATTKFEIELIIDYDVPEHIYFTSL